MVDPAESIALEARSLAAGYSGRPIITNIDLAIPRGTFTALIGPNGSGKSTLLRALGGLLPADGRVDVAGRAIATMSRKALAREISLLPQSPSAPEGLTVIDLVRQGRYPYRSLLGFWSASDEGACAEALSATGMDALASHPLDTLSGGQRQRAWIAMTLAQQADVLLLDEPTTFLDVAHQIEVLDLLSALIYRNGSTIIAVLHDINQAARYANRIAVLDEGTLVAQGTPSEIITESMLATVFDVKTRVLDDPVNGTPFFLPYGKAVGGSDFACHR